MYSNPDSLLNRATQHALFPDNVYGVDSGGDPECIPDLTFSQFQNFHRTYYHPANSKIFFYGNDDPLVRLQLLDEYLSAFTKTNSQSTSSRINYQKPLDFSQLSRRQVGVLSTVFSISLFNPFNPFIASGSCASGQGFACPAHCHRELAVEPRANVICRCFGVGCAGPFAAGDSGFGFAEGSAGISGKCDLDTSLSISSIVIVS